jgi:hypothetical protein
VGIGSDCDCFGLLKVIDCLLTTRLINNEGFDLKTFNRLSQKRTRLRHMLKLADIHKLNWDKFPWGLFTYNEESLNNPVGYIGELTNEVITEIMTMLVNERR